MIVSRQITDLGLFCEPLLHLRLLWVLFHRVFDVEPRAILVLNRDNQTALLHQLWTLLGLDDAVRWSASLLAARVRRDAMRCERCGGVDITRRVGSMQQHVSRVFLRSAADWIGTFILSDNYVPCVFHNAQADESALTCVLLRLSLLEQGMRGSTENSLAFLQWLDGLKHEIDVVLKPNPAPDKLSRLLTGLSKLPAKVCRRCGRWRGFDRL
jgi:hypothetical protein